MSTASALSAQPVSFAGKLERWAGSHAGIVVALALILGFALRLAAALGTYLNPDEALHHVLVNQASLGAAYKASLTNAHPPLYFVLLYYWRFVGSSELMLRLPSILAGTAACWFAFRWVALALGQTAGLAALLLASLSPALVALGAEVRAYSVFLLWMSVALYFLERALRDRRVSSMVFYSLFLYLAILSHYSAVWFVVAAGIYVLIRIRSLTPRARAVWAAMQVGAAGIYAWLYVSHISKLRGSPMEAEAVTGWLRGVYFQRASMTPIAFLKTASVGLFRFLFASNAGAVALGLFLAAILWLLIASLRTKRGDLAAFGLFLLLPFALGFGGSLADVYPYGGTRHCVYLIFFATAGVSFVLAKLTNQKILPLLILAALLVPQWYRHRRPDPQDMDRESQKMASMTDAIGYLRASIPPGQPFFTDYQASILLEYYLGRDHPPPPATECAGVLEMKYGPYRVLVVPGWSASAADLKKSVNAWRGACSAGGAKSFWVFDSGWGLNLLDDMQAVAPQSVSEARHFGVTTALFKFTPER